MLAWLRGLFATPQEKALRRLSRTLRSPDPGARHDAVQQLSRLGAPPAAELLVGCLSDPDPSVRESACAALGAFGEPGVAPLSAALSHPDPAVGKLAARALGATRSPAAAAPLLRALKFGDHALRPTVVEALEKVGAPAAGALREALADPYPYVRKEVEGILARLGEPVPGGEGVDKLPPA